MNNISSRKLNVTYNILPKPPLQIIPPEKDFTLSKQNKPQRKLKLNVIKKPPLPKPLVKTKQEIEEGKRVLEKRYKDRLKKFQALQKQAPNLNKCEAPQKKVFQPVLEAETLEKKQRKKWDNPVISANNMQKYLNLLSLKSESNSKYEKDLFSKNPNISLFNVSGDFEDNSLNYKDFHLKITSTPKGRI